MAIALQAFGRHSGARAVTADHLALIVLADSFQDAALNSLGSQRPDVDALSDVLLDRGRFNVAIVRNEESHVVAECIERFLAECAPDDIVLLYLSTQGLRDNSSGDLFFAAANTRPGLLASTALDVKLIQRCIGKSRARQIVLLLDCGFGELFQADDSPATTGTIDLGDHFRIEGIEENRDIVVVSGQTAVEYSFRKGAYAHGDRSVTRNLARAFTEAIIACCQDSSGEGCVTVGEINEVLDQAAGAGNEGVTLATMVLGAGDRICMAAREQAVAPESKSESTVADAEIVDVAPTGAIADDLPGAASSEPDPSGRTSSDPTGAKSTAPQRSAVGLRRVGWPLAVALVVCVILAVALVVTNRRALSSSQASSTPTVRVTTTQTVNHDRTVTQTVTPTPTTTTYPGSAAFNSLVQTLPAVLRSDCAEDPDPRFVANARCTYSGRTVSYAQFESPTAATEWVTDVAPTADAPCTTRRSGLDPVRGRLPERALVGVVAVGPDGAGRAARHLFADGTVGALQPGAVGGVDADAHRDLRARVVVAGFAAVMQQGPPSATLADDIFHAVHGATSTRLSPASTAKPRNGSATSRKSRRRRGPR